MVLLIEEQTYKKEILEKYLGKYGHRDGKVLCVGYFFKLDTYGQGEPVYILPKIFAEKMVPKVQVMEPMKLSFDNADKSYNWDKYSEIFLNAHKTDNDKKWEAKTFYQLSSWLYRSLDHYRSRLIANKIVCGQEGYIFEASKDATDEESTLQDLIFALDHFYHTHKDLFVFIQKKAHSGVNKVDWAKTVRKGRAFIMSGNTPRISYDSVCGTRKEIDFDERLMVLFFNTLYLLQSEGYYDFSITHSYHLISPNQFKVWVESGKVLSELRGVRNNYFNDQMRELWHLLFEYYSKRNQMQHIEDKVEYLLTTDFDRVFEDMIDFILGDTPGSYPKELKKQAGGTRLIDHLFLGTSLFDDKKIYYVGDSKYYSERRTLEDASIHKEYDYVNNIVQLAMEVRNNQRNWNQKNEIAKNYYDELTRGYNITPNFFIRGRVESGYDFQEAHLEEYVVKMQKKDDNENTPNVNSKYFRSHFPHLLFDRNTLWLLEYSINILFVLKVYGAQAAKNPKTSIEQETRAKMIKEVISERIRKDLLNRIRDKFSLYRLEPQKDEEGKNIVSKKECLSMIENNLYRMEGMIFSSAQNIEELIFAQPKKSPKHVERYVELAKDELKKYYQFQSL